MGTRVLEQKVFKSFLILAKSIVDPATYGCSLSSVRVERTLHGRTEKISRIKHNPLSIHPLSRILYYPFPDATLSFHSSNTSSFCSAFFFARGLNSISTISNGTLKIPLKRGGDHSTHMRTHRLPFSIPSPKLYLQMFDKPEVFTLRGISGLRGFFDSHAGFKPRAIKIARVRWLTHHHHHHHHQKPRWVDGSGWSVRSWEESEANDWEEQQF